MSFFMRNYKSDEQYDISKFLNYSNGVYDVLASPFLSDLCQLPTIDYYYVDEGYKDIDLIASSVYGDMFFAYLIQFYNNDFRTTFPEGTVLRLFSTSDLNELYYTIEARENESNREL